MTTIEEAAAALPPGTPEIGTTGFIAELFGVSSAAVHYRIVTGAIPAVAVPSGGGRVTHVVRPVDVALIWADRLKKKSAASAA